MVPSLRMQKRWRARSARSCASCTAALSRGNSLSTTIGSFFALLLAQTDGALLYHCTAGKDRVGVGTMLLLTALGVDWPVIVENYLITNERMAASTDCLLTAVKDYDLTEAERDVIRTFDCADVEFLTAARDAAEARYGSMDAFLSQALGVGEAEREILRARWLTE